MQRGLSDPVTWLCTFGVLEPPQAFDIPAPETTELSEAQLQCITADIASPGSGALHGSPVVQAQRCGDIRGFFSSPRRGRRRRRRRRCCCI